MLNQGEGVICLCEIYLRQVDKTNSHSYRRFYMACFLIWCLALWLDAAYYVSRFQQAVDEQCPDSGIVVGMDGYSNDPFHRWVNSEARCYLDPSGEYICSGGSGR